MIELLHLCGYEAHEIESEVPRVQKVFNRFGITIEDIEQGKQRLNKYYEMKLQGVRKTFGLFLKDLINTVLAREEGKKKILYGFMSPGFEILGSAIVSKSKEIFVATLPISFYYILGCVFDKIVPILEASEARWLKAGKVSHCANIKTLVGLLSLDLIPKPDLLITSSFLCDNATKTIDLVHELYKIPTYAYDACEDREFREYPDSSRIIKYSANGMRRLALKIQDIVDFEITDDMLWESIDARKGLQKALINQQNLLEKADPLPISTTHEVFSNNLGALPLTTHELKEPIEALEILYREIKNKVDHGEGVVEKGAPRILSLLPPHSSDPRWEHMICELGIAPLASENNLFPIHGTRSLDLGQEKPKDPYEQLSQKLQISYYQNISSRGAIIIEACKRLNVDGVLARSHVGCRAPAAGTLIVKGAIESKLGIPVMLMERDDFDPRSYNDEYKRQMELFKDILNNSRKRKQS